MSYIANATPATIILGMSVYDQQILSAFAIGTAHASTLSLVFTTITYKDIITL